MSLAWELVDIIEVTGAAETSVEFTDLDFGKDDDLMLECSVNTSSVNSNISLFVNGNETLTNYYTQSLYNSDTLANGNRVNRNDVVNLLNDTYSTINVKLANSGHFVAMSNQVREVGSSAPIRYSTVNASTFTISSITSLKLACFASGVPSNTIGIGSTFKLYKRVAEVVADITVTEATTQVDLTGLDITKAGEYILKATLVGGQVAKAAYHLHVNGNTTDANYYFQRLLAINTAVTGLRSTAPYFANNNNAETSLVSVDIKVTNAGYFTAQSSNAHDLGSSMELWRASIASTFTVSAITELNIISSITDGIGVGSRFQLIKMKSTTVVSATPTETAIYSFGGRDGVSAYSDTDQYLNFTWTNKTDMPSPARRSHSASAIGEVSYVYGGYTTSELQDTDEYSDDSWTNKTNMPTPARYDMGAVTLGDASYVFGGANTGAALSDNDQYDPDVWTAKTSIPSPARRVHTAITIGSTGYMMGGDDDSNNLQDTDSYVPDTWSNKTSMPTPARKGHASSTIDGKGYVFGGYTTGAIQNTDEYSVDTWTSKLDIPSPARYNSSANTSSGTGYLFGGTTGSDIQDNDAYDPDTWVSRDDMPSPARRNHASSAITTDVVASTPIPNASIYVMGGSDGSNPLSDTDEYTPNAWTNKTDMVSPARERLSGTNIEGTAYVSGGRNSSPTYVQDTDAYNPDTWTSKTSMPTPARGLGSMDTLANAGYFIGGVDNTPNRLTDNDQYIPDTWTAMTSLGAVRWKHGSGVIGDSIYIFGGQEASGTIGDTDTYAYNSWAARTAMGTARSGVMSFELSDKIYACGGENASSTYVSTVEEYSLDAWTAMTSLPSARGYQEADSLSDTNGYAIGGDVDTNKLNDVDEYVSDTWTNKLDMPAPNRSSSAVVAIQPVTVPDPGVGGTGYIYGGIGTARIHDTDAYADGSWTSETDMPLNSLSNAGTYELAGCNIDNAAYAWGGNGNSALQDNVQYVPTTWTSKTSMPTPARQALTAESVGYYGYALGGKTALTDTDEYAVDSWVNRADMTLGRYGAASFDLDNRIYLAGGYSGASLDDTDEFVVNTWTAKTDLPLPARYYLMGTAIDNKGYIFGGYAPSASIANTDEYQANTWTTKADMTTARHDGGSFALGSAGYVAGGTNTAETKQSVNEEYYSDVWTDRTDIPSPARSSMGSCTIPDTYSFFEATFTSNTIHVEKHGNDTTGDGTEAFPYFSIDKAVTSASTGDYIKLGDGKFDIDGSLTYLRDLLDTGGKGLTYIGNGKNTEIAVLNTFSIDTTDYTGESMSMYNLVLKSYDPDIVMAFWYSSDHAANEFEMHFYNVAFDTDESVQSDGYFWFASGAGAQVTLDITFDNCTFAQPTDSLIARSSGLVFTNCAAETTPAWGTTGFTATTSILNAEFDTSYNITSGTWENAGTGINSDGSQADIGVYGGYYEWDAGNTNVFGYLGAGAKVAGYVFGGTDGSVLQDTDEYIPDTWTNKTDMPTPARSDLAASTIGSSGYIYGGNSSPTWLADTDEYTPDSWASKTDMPVPARGRLASSTISSSGYVYGGVGAALYQDTDEYTPDSWANKTDMPTPARYYLAASTIGGSSYIYGGYGTASLRDCDEYTPDAWANKTDMPTPDRYRLAASTIGSSGYVYGGASIGYLQDCDEYTPDTWTNKTDMPTPSRGYLAASTIGSSGYVYGGRSVSRLLDCDEYTPDTWTNKSDMPAPNRSTLAASSI